MAWVTYTPEAGDDRAVTYMGIEMFAGQPVEIDDPSILAKAVGNGCFEVSDEAPKRRGRPPKEDSAAEAGEGA